MRLFIAVKISEEVQEELIRLQKEIDQEGLKLPKEFHVTLKFLGDIDENDLETLKTRLAEIQFNKFKLTLDGLDVFQPKRIRVIHIRTTPEAQIKDLFEKIHKATEDIKLDHTFRSHLTIARVKFLHDRKAFLEKIKPIKPKPIEFDVNAFYLIKSTLAGDGPIYEDLAEFAAKPL
ncbi:MAG: RNA 2',3'-cyclic phosphodiesterase [Nanoarchaeota archaeon]|nr:RNA 2',3'-cyclic phosphodiesterase [Nanoarchaeota archaeon]